MYRNVKTVMFKAYDTIKPQIKEDKAASPTCIPPVFCTSAIFTALVM
jgi:hypothetical protein